MKVTMIMGDGIGPEVSKSVESVIDSLGVKIEWEKVNAGLDVYEEIGELIPANVFESIERNKIAIKGPITTPVGKGFRSINVQLRRKYDLYSNVRPIKSYKGVESPFKGLDMVIFRENTEGLYIGEEKRVSEDEAHALKIVTRKGSTRIAREAFEYAKTHNKKTISVVHKGNILKYTDGLFLEAARKVAKDYPEIEVSEVIVDNMAMQMVINPNQFEVILAGNLYGDILSDLGAGLVGGLGMIPGANIGEDIAIFEAVHGSAPDIAGKGIANPTALLLSSVMMLRHIGYRNEGDILETAIAGVLEEGQKTTRDLKGSSSTLEYTNAIIEKIKDYKTKV